MRKSYMFLVLIWISLLITCHSYAQTPQWLWAKSAGGTNEDFGYCVTVDASGNAYVTGYFSSPTLSFGTYTLTNKGSNDIFLAKYDATGNVLWAKSAGGTGDDRALAVTVDNSGNAYVTGYFFSPFIIFGSDTLYLNSYEDIFLTKYDASGNVVWAKSAGGTFHDIGKSVVLDGSGNIYLAGYFESYHIYFGSNVLTNAGGNDMFLAKYDTAGNVLWAVNPSGTSQDFGFSVAADNNGNAYVTGYFSAYTYIVFGSDTLYPVGANDIYLAKYNADGNIVWAKDFGGMGNDIGNGLAADNSGNIFMTGYFGDKIIFGSDTLVNHGEINLFLVKFDHDGNPLWAKSAGGTKFDYGYSVAADASGNILITGGFSSLTISFGPWVLSNAGSTLYTEDVFLAKYDAGGNVLWAKSAGGVGNDYGNSVALDASENAYVAGYYSSPSIIFGADTLTNAGTYDILLAKSEGGSTWINEFNRASNILVYPNPSVGQIKVTIPAGEPGSIVKIFNMQGKEFLQSEVNKSTTIIDVSMLPNGLYIVKCINENSLQNRKFVKL